MSVGAWEPVSEAPNDQSRKEIDDSLLQRIIEAVEATETINPAEENPDLSGLDSELLSASWLAGLPATQWLEEAAQWDSAKIWKLIQFFTLAEMQLQDWQGGAESPVIPLAKSLRRSKSPLSREQLLWIRQHSDNRFLPYGPL